MSSLPSNAGKLHLEGAILGKLTKMKNPPLEQLYLILADSAGSGRIFTMLDPKCPNGIEQHYIFDFYLDFWMVSGRFWQKIRPLFPWELRTKLSDRIPCHPVFVFLHHVDHVLMRDEPEESWVPSGRMDEQVIPLDDS